MRFFGPFNTRSFLSGSSALITVLLLTACTFKGSTKVIYLKPGQVQVLPGDTLASVALRHQVGVRELAHCNNLKPPFSLRGIGVLTLPSTDNSEISSSGTLPPHAPANDAEEGPSLVQADHQVQWSSMDDHDNDIVEARETPRQTAQPAPQQTMVADVPQEEDDAIDPDLLEEKPQPTGTKKRFSATSQPTIRSRVTPADPSCSFIKPVSGSVKRGFSPKKSSDGIDFATSTRAPVRAIASGVVVHAGAMAGEPNSLILIKHADGWSSCYRSLDTVKVKANQTISQGDILGTTKNRTLRFDLRQNRKPVDPMKHVDMQ